MNVTKFATLAAALLVVVGVSAGLSWAGYEAFHGTSSDQANVASLIADTPKAKVPEPTKGDRDRIVGVWRIASGSSNGQAMPVLFRTLARITFTKDGEMRMALLQEEKKFKYQRVEPGKIDLTPGMGGKEPALAIYKFEGNDRLTICVTDDGGKTRPTDFTAEKASGRALLTLTRAKPGEETPTKDELAKFGGVEKILQGSEKGISENNLKQIGLAMHNYASTTKSLPAYAIYSKDGKTPLLSWRVAILPYIEYSRLYEEFKLDEPWDSEHNKKLIPKMPRVYVVGKAKPGETHYQVIVGPDTIFDGAKKMTLAGITDGTSNTIMALEAKDAIIWTRPDVLQMPQDKKKLPAVGGIFPEGFHVLMCDGSVRMMAPNVDAAVFRAAVTPKGND